jgi:hypothetical protein
MQRVFSVALSPKTIEGSSDLLHLSRLKLMSSSERTAKPHEFWLATCGYDTYRRGPNYARLDTPWNAFTRDESALVCTLWVDGIVDVYDPQSQRVRRFVRLGGKSRDWKGVAVQHGREARENLDKAVALQRPVFGYEAEPNAAALARGDRVVQHFYLDRAHQLKGWIGLRLEDLNERLNIDAEFRRRGIVDDIDPGAPAATLFELVDVTAEVPGAARAEPAEPADEDSEVDARFDGNLSAEEYGRIALPILVAHVLAQRDGVLVPLTYLRLAELLGRRTKSGVPWARGLGHVLGHVTKLVSAAGELLGEQLPFLTSIVVLSTGTGEGLPAKGVAGYWPGYEALSFNEKQAKVRAEHDRVLRFGSRWNEVLRLAGFPPVPIPSPQARRGGWGGGESDEHKALKRYVRKHPELFGAQSDWFSQEEYALRSGDEIDVMFKSNRIWVGVEVKSRVSDALLSDYERGLYQVVKYRAVLQAQAQVDHPDNPPEVIVVLALESALPAVYGDLATRLSVRCIGGLRPALSDSGAYGSSTSGREPLVTND